MIYFIQDTNSKAVKIGHGNNPLKRLAACQTGTPFPLSMVGTLPGGAAEESLLHDQFEAFHLRGEWFKGEPELLDMIRRMVFANGTPATVWDECRKRGGCRSGLRGVVIGVKGWTEAFKVYASQWAAGRKLILAIYAASDPDPVHRWVGPPRDAGMLTVTAADIAEGRYRAEYPESFIPEIDADQCVLFSEWPIVCCEPSQRIEDWEN